MLNANKDLKLYYSVSEVARMLGVTESLLRYWEKEFPQLNPKRGGRGIRQYSKEEIEMLKLIHYLVKEQGMTLAGARKRLKEDKKIVQRNVELLNRLKNIREELVEMKQALDGFTYEEVAELKKGLERSQGE